MESLVEGQKQVAALKRVTYSSKQSNDFELALLPKLSHPNIIKVYDFREVQEGEGDHGFDLLLEYAQKGMINFYLGDLSSYVQKQFKHELIPEDQLIKWLCQICLGLHYLHN